MIKFDFAYFDCDNPEHKFHARGGAESKEPAIRNFIEMIKEFITLMKNLKEVVGDKVDSIDDIKAIIASAKEAIELLKQYETIKTNKK